MTGRCGSMKVILALLLLLLPAQAAADLRVGETVAPAAYTVKATSIAPHAGKTCGAARRMLKDTHLVVGVEDKFYVDGMRWASLTDSSMPGEAYIAFHHGQKYWLTLWFIANDNRLIGLYALNGPGCQDVVRIEGVRR